MKKIGSLGKGFISDYGLTQLVAAACAAEVRRTGLECMPTLIELHSKYLAQATKQRKSSREASKEFIAVAEEVLQKVTNKTAPDNARSEKNIKGCLYEFMHTLLKSGVSREEAIGHYKELLGRLKSSQSASVTQMFTAAVTLPDAAGKSVVITAGGGASK